MDFQHRSDMELIDIYRSLMEELRDRGIIRSKNLIGDLGEYVAIEMYNKTPGLPNLQLAMTTMKNVDAVSRKGERYSIKTITGKSTGVFYGLPGPESQVISNRNFEYLIIVKFDNQYRLEWIAELTWNQFLEFKRWHSRMQAWSIVINKELLKAARMIYQG